MPIYANPNDNPVKKGLYLWIRLLRVIYSSKNNNI